MSKNKIIKELHETTLISFKDCRATLKHNKWNFRAAYIKLNGGLNPSEYNIAAAEFMEQITHVADELTRAFLNLQKPIKAAAESAAKFAGAVLAAYNKENGGEI